MSDSSRRIGAGRRWMGCFARSLLCTGLAWSAAAVLMSSTALGFVEEPHTSPNQSTIHYAMTHALAVCAGYGSDADTVATYDQITDRADQTTGYTGNVCDGVAPPTYNDPITAQKKGATLKELVKIGPGGCVSSASLTFPNRGTPGTCYTARTNGYLMFFHFNSALYNQPFAIVQGTNYYQWAWGTVTALVGDRKAFYGGMPGLPLTWKCEATWPNQTINTGATTPGSYQALGIFLHSLADVGSHWDCNTHAYAAVDVDTKLSTPTHHNGVNPHDVCEPTEHTIEFQESGANTPGEYPIYRTLETIVGHSAMTWLWANNRPPAPYDTRPLTPYSFDGLYKYLLQWRTDHPGNFIGKPNTIPNDLNNATYQAMMKQVQGFVFNHTTDSWNQGPARITDAANLEAYCNAHRP